MRSGTMIWSTLAFFTLAWSAAAQRADKPVDPVEELRRALTEPIKNPSNFEEYEFRRRNVLEKINALRTIGQMGNALAMPEGWLDTSIDQELRAELAERLYARIRGILATGNTDQKLAALTLIGSLGRVRGAAKYPTLDDTQAAIIGEMFGDRLGLAYLGTGAWIPPNRGRIARPLAPDVIEMLANPDEAIRIKAAQTLGQINADPKLAAPALQDVIAKSKARELRRTAATALVELARNATEAYANRLASGASNQYGGRREDPGSMLAAQEFLREDLLEMIPAVVMAARTGMDDGDDQVELASSEAVTIAARALGVLVPDPFLRRDFPAVGRPWTELERRLVDDYRRAVNNERRELLPAARALAQLEVKQEGNDVPPIVNVLEDEDAPVRLQGCSALQEITYARWKLVQRAASVPPYDQAG
ncbi:MAG: HEAT repeat domain-containing protein, partial [Gemmataceae bacterium]